MGLWPSSFILKYKDNHKTSSNSLNNIKYYYEQREWRMSLQDTDGSHFNNFSNINNYLTKVPYNFSRIQQYIRYSHITFSEGLFLHIPIVKFVLSPMTYFCFNIILFIFHLLIIDKARTNKYSYSIFSLFFFLHSWYTQKSAMFYILTVTDNNSPPCKI